jgi:hypothetical protein
MISWGLRGTGQSKYTNVGARWYAEKALKPQLIIHIVMWRYLLLILKQNRKWKRNLSQIFQMNI